MVKYILKLIRGDLCLGFIQQPLYAIPPKFCICFEHISGKGHFLVICTVQDGENLLYCLNPLVSLIRVKSSSKTRWVRLSEFSEFEIFQVYPGAIRISFMTSLRSPSQLVHHLMYCSSLLSHCIGHLSHHIHEINRIFLSRCCSWPTSPTGSHQVLNTRNKSY